MRLSSSCNEWIAAATSLPDSRPWATILPRSPQDIPEAMASFVVWITRSTRDKLSSMSPAFWSDDAA